MTKKIKLLIMCCFLLAGEAVLAAQNEPYVYNVEQAAQRKKDIFLAGYLGIGGLPFGVYAGISATVEDMKFLPILYLNGTLEMPYFKFFDYSGKAGLSFGKWVNEEQRIVVRSYSGGYNVTVNEYIPVYTPVHRAFHVYGMVQRSQMPSMIQSGLGINTVANVYPDVSPDNGTFFVGGGIGASYAADYVITVVKGNSFNQKYDYFGASDINLNILYAPAGLYQGFAASLDLTGYYRLLFAKFEVFYSFADGKSSGVTMNVLDRARLKFAFGINFGLHTKQGPKYDMACTIARKKMEECLR